MAQLIGTGQDLRYPEGVAFDVPEETQQQLIDELIEKGDAKFPEGGHDEIREVEIANGVVRGDAHTLPQDAEIAAKIEEAGTAHDVTHSGDPNAKKGDHDLDQKTARQRAHKHQPLARARDGKKGTTEKEKGAGPTAGPEPSKTPTPRG